MFVCNPEQVVLLQCSANTEEEEEDDIWEFDFT
jgi:hypothetical protein